MQDFGDFWLNREAQNYTSEIINGQLTIQLTTVLDLSQNLGLVVSNGQDLMSINVLDLQGNNVERIIEDHGSEDVVVYFQENVTSVNDEFKQQQVIEVFPNPTMEEFTVQMDWPITGNLKLEIYDLYGKEVTELINEATNGRSMKFSKTLHVKNKVMTYKFTLKGSKKRKSNFKA